MKNLLYIGNKLSKHGNNATSIETLGLLLENEGFKVYYSSSKKNKIFRLLDMIFTTIKLKRKVDFVLIDVYSTHNFWYAFIVSQLCRIFGLKYIPKLHGGNLPSRFEKNHQLCKMIFNHAHVNIAPSNYLLTAFEKHKFSNVLHVPNTIEIKNYPFKKRNAIQPKLLWVRSFAKIYNPSMAILVFDALKKEYPQATLCMVGPDKDGSLILSQKMALDLGLPVLFTGKLSKKEWIALSQDYDIFINTTHFDNTPVSVIEAMALGLAVVTTNVGGIPFLVVHNEDALKVNDNATDDMVSEIKKLIEKPELFLELTTNARRKGEGFDWDVIKSKWFKILQ
jgi:glycosyltransferase involved in cell wall biosynthesis